MAGIIGASGPGHRICVMAENYTGEGFCYTMDLSAFKVKKSSKCYKVKLLDKKRGKDEHLVVGDSLLGDEHYHYYDDDAESLDCGPLFETDCSLTSVAAVDKSTIYCISYCKERSHSHGDEPLVHRIRLVEDGCGGKLVAEKEKCAPTLYCRLSPEMLAFDGKLYVFGGLPQPRGCERGDLEDKEKVECPWSEVFDPVTGEWEVFTTSSPFSYVENSSIYQQSYADIYQSRIVIISPITKSVFVYNANSKTGWERLFFSIYLSDVRQKPVLVGSTLYWLDREVCALDLETHAYVSGNFPSYELSDILEDFWENHCRLLHIGDDEDVFCLVWHGNGLCHFTRVRLSKDLYGVLGISIISCSSKPIQIITYINDALLMDRVVKDASGSASILKRCKKRGDDSMQPLSLKDDASGSASILKRCKKRSVDSVKPLSLKVDVSSKKTRVYSEKLLQSTEDASDGKVLSTADIEKLLQSKDDASDGEVMSTADILEICMNRRVDPKKYFPSK